MPPDGNDDASGSDWISCSAENFSITVGAAVLARFLVAAGTGPT